MNDPAATSNANGARKGAFPRVLALALTPLAVALCSVVLSPLHVSASATDAITFALGVALAVGGLLSIAIARIEERTTWIAAGAGALTLVLAASLRGRGVVWASAIDGGLVLVASAMGGSVGRRVEHPGHLLAACAVASAADMLSVFSAIGPTHAIVARPDLLAVFALSAPIVGTHAFAPSIGAGDLVFIALLLGVATRHALGLARVTIAALLGLALAGFAAATLHLPVPALPAIAIAVVAVVPASRRVQKRDRGVTRAVVLGALVIAAIVVARLVSSIRAGR